MNLPSYKLASIRQRIEHRQTSVRGGSHPSLQEVYAEFAPHLGVPFCIAGGAVRDIVHGYAPRDFDLFCFRRPPWRMLAAIYGAAPRETHQYRDALCMTLGWRGHKVQIIWRKSLTTVMGLLDEFDWRCCLWAYDGADVRRHSDAEGVGPGLILHIQNPATPETSLARGERFAKRYGMAIDPHDRAMLEEKMQGSYRQKVLDRLRHKATREQRRMAA